MITLYNPTGEGGHQGGGVAAPVGGQVLSEVLPYLEVNKDNESDENVINKVNVPDLEGLTVKEAKEQLKELNLNIQCSGDESENFDEHVIQEQIPVSGVEVFEGSTIIVK